jgi:ligand-binding sensor domain-containing protein
MFKHLNQEQGLSNSFITNIFQDTRGHMWFGTYDGLNKYDGYKLTVYKNKPGDNSSINSNWVFIINEDKRGNLWIGTRKGLNRFNYSNNTFDHYPLGKSDVPENSHIRCIYTDKRGNFWVSSNDNLYLFNYKTNKFNRVKASVKSAYTSPETIVKLFEDSKGNFLVLTDKSLNIFDYKTFTFHPFLFEKKKVLRGSGYHSIAEDRQGNLWIGSYKSGVLKLNISKNLYKVYNYEQTSSRSISGNNTCLLVDQQDKVWLGELNGGLDLYNPDTDTFYNYGHDAEDPTSLSSRSVSALYTDIQGNLWVGTLAGGVEMHSPEAKKFTYYKEGNTSRDLSYKDIRAVAEDNEGNIWVGTDGGGINLMNPTQRTFKVLKNNPDDSRTLSSNLVISLLKDRDGAIWAGTWTGGLNLYNPKTSTFTHFLQKKTKDANANNVTSIYDDKRRNLWISTYDGGLSLFDRKHKKFSKIDPIITNFKGENISCFGEDSTGNLWVSTNSGINKYDYHTGKFANYYIKKHNAIQLARVIFCDKKGRIWVGATGLYLFNPARKIFLDYSRNSVLKDYNITSILEDYKGNFWLSTTNGLLRFNPETMATKLFHTSEGIQGLEFRRAALKAKNGEFFLGGSNGLNSFFPANVKTNTYIPPVYITDFQIFNKKVVPGKNSFLKSDIEETKKITLTYKESVFSFEFAAINYILTENNQYAYKMEGFDKDWNHVGNVRTATYTNLDPGEYTFRVKASNNDGVWNEEGAAIRIIITPPYWATWWFRTMALFSLFASAIAFYHYRINEIKEQKRVLEFQVESRTAEVVHQSDQLKAQAKKLQSEQLKNQINPHFLFNTLNNAHVLTRKDPLKAAQVLIKLSDLLKYQLYDSAGNRVVLSADIQFIKDFLDLEKIRRDQFEYSVVHEGNLSNILIAPLLFIIFVENAVKHNMDAEKVSFVHLRFWIEDEHLCFNCTNSKPAKAQHTEVGGLGLANVKRRLELLYPEQHSLSVVNGADIFTVDLKIKV